MRPLSGIFRFVLISAALLFSACAAQPEPPQTTISASIPEDSCFGIGDRIFFDVDNAGLRPDAIKTIETWVEWFTAYPFDDLVLEGHANSRGSAEYNMALARQRAEAAKDALIARGLPPERMRVVSYGEKLPAVLGENRAAWAQNRRAVIVVKNYLKTPEIPCG